MKLKTLLVATALLTGCNDPGMTANAPASAPAENVQPIAGGLYQIRVLTDRQRHNVCYVVSSTTRTVAPAVSCVADMSDDEPDCTPAVTAKDGTEFPGVCPADFEGR